MPSPSASSAGPPASAPAADPLAWLTEAERAGYNYFVENRHRPGSKYAPIATSRAMAMFTLYLNGCTLRQVWEQNKDFGWGQVVAAAVEGEWPKLRAEYLKGLFTEAAVRAKQTQSEAVNFVSDAMAAAHKLHGDALRKFLQTGNPEDLGAFGIGSVKQYKDMVELLMKLSGQEAKVAQKVSGTVKHEHVVRTVPTAPPPAAVGQHALDFLTSWGAEELDKQRAEGE